MIIAKHLSLGKRIHIYRAIGTVNGLEVIGYGHTHSEALEEAFNNLYRHE